MKKVFSICVMCLMCVFVSAQNVDWKKGWYVTANAGTTLYDNVRSWAEPNNTFIDLAVGKDINSIFAFEVSVSGDMSNGGRFFDSHEIGAAVVTNLSNLIHYTTTREFVELSITTGAGWFHVAGYNNIAAHLGVTCDFNIADNIALGITPEYTVMANSPINHTVDLLLGITYRF